MVMPEVDQAVHRRADELLLKLQIEGMERGDGKLYDGVAILFKGSAAGEYGCLSQATDWRIM